MSWRIKIKRLLCRHRYCDANLTSCDGFGWILLSNYCIKCGKPFSVTVSKRCIDKQIEKYEEGMSKDGYFTGK